MIFENDNQYNSTNQRKQAVRNTNFSVLEKLAPQATDIEQDILGAILLQYNHIPISVFSTLQPEMFYKNSYQTIYRAIKELRGEKKPVDLKTVKSKLTSMGKLEEIGGFYVLIELTENVAQSSNIETHILIVHQMFLKRELIRISSECIGNMYEDTEDPLQQIKSIIKQISDLEKGIFKRSEKDTTALIKEVTDDLNAPKKNGMLGYTTGLAGLDHVTRGDQVGSLKVIAGATSAGKTLHLCTEVLNSCFDQNKQLLAEQIDTAIFSLEMTSIQVTYRLLSNLSSIPNTAIKTGQLTEEEKQRLSFSWLNLKKLKFTLMIHRVYQ